MMKRILFALLAVLVTTGVFSKEAIALDFDDVPSGITWGGTIGWFGQFYDGDNTDNGMSVGIYGGLKIFYFGLSLDFDVSMSPTDERFHDLWTYSISGLLMGYLPFSSDVMATVGFGIGFTGWSLDYEYTEREVEYDWWYDEYYVTEHEYSRTLEEGKYLSLKLKARIDFVFDNIMMGVEFDWIPCIDTSSHHDGIVNNILGVQLHFGGIDVFE